MRNKAAAALNGPIRCSFSSFGDVCSADFSYFQRFVNDVFILRIPPLFIIPSTASSLRDRPDVLLSFCYPLEKGASPDNHLFSTSPLDPPILTPSLRITITQYR